MSRALSVRTSILAPLLAYSAPQHADHRISGCSCSVPRQVSQPSGRRKAFAADGLFMQNVDMATPAGSGKADLCV